MCANDTQFLNHSFFSPKMYTFLIEAYFLLTDLLITKTLVSTDCLFNSGSILINCYIQFIYIEQINILTQFNTN